MTVARWEVVVGVLQQIYAPLSRAGSTQVLMRAAHWNLEMAQTDSCRQHYAETETGKVAVGYRRSTRQSSNLSNTNT